MTHKPILIFITVCLTALCLNSCKDDVANAGSSALRNGEDVIICSDTLTNIRSALWLATPCVSLPDSFLLGECASKDYGKLKADILTQFACPEGWVFPDNSELDSVCLYLYYRSWYGDGNAPLGLQAYVLDGEALVYDSLYASDVDISRFCSLADTLRLHTEDQVIVASAAADSMYSSVLGAYVSYIRIRLDDRWANRLFSMQEYTSQADFNSRFPGIYLTSTYGTSVALYVNSLCMTIHYHYTYPSSDSESGYKTMNDNKILYANSEVKQVARYDYSDRESVFARLKADSTVNYILSPANIYTRLQMPMATIIDTIEKKVNYRRSTYINYAHLRLDVLNSRSQQDEEGNWASPASTMLLINEKRFDDVFSGGVLPTDTMAVLGSLSTYYDSDSAVYRSYYDFDLSAIFTHRLHEQNNDTLSFLLVPVDVEYSYTSSSTYLSNIRLKQAVTATKISSASDKNTPMDVELIYSGFTDMYIGK